MENPIKMDDSGVPLFSETSSWIVLQPFLAGAYWWTNEQMMAVLANEQLVGGWATVILASPIFFNLLSLSVFRVFLKPP